MVFDIPPFGCKVTQKIDICKEKRHFFAKKTIGTLFVENIFVILQTEV